MKKNRDIYFVGNAHLDPVWMWQWQEGSAEAKATLRSALDRMKEYPDFIFVCSASRVFEWIEEFDPDMFEEIRQRVQEDRLHIVGGWYIQPDCNNPSGESFARHGLYAQRYFKEKFGVTARIGYNVDSFGHNLSIPKLLKGAGMDYYLFMRPGQEEKAMVSHAFRWQSPDGSEVLACRLPRMYSTTRTDIDDMETFQAAVEELEDKANPAIEVVPFFFGVGNHGGGPTKKNIESILAFRDIYGKDRVHFSNLQDMFDRLEEYRAVMPLHTDDLQHHAAGCYATVTAVKEGIRRAECDLYAAEVFGHMANVAMGKKLPDLSELERAWKNVLFAHFHDSMGGCSLKVVHESTVRSLGETRSIADRLENNALQSLSWKIDSRDFGRGFPIVLFNPHAFPVTQAVEVEKRLLWLKDAAGNEVPIQYVNSETKLCRDSWGKTRFVATVPAMGYACCYFQQAMLHEHPENVIEPPYQVGNVIENGSLRVAFDPKTGFITCLQDKKSGQNLIKGFGGVPVIIDEYGHDTWSHAMNFFDKEAGTMALKEMLIKDDGPVTKSMRVDFTYGGSSLRLTYRITEGSPFLDTEAELFWHETRRMLKIRFDTHTTAPRAYYHIPYGHICRPCDGEEAPGLQWIAARDGSKGVAMVNDGRYSFSVKGSSMNITAIRSPYYVDHNRRQDRNKTDLPVTEQGEHAFRFAIRAMEKDEPWHKLQRDAALYNRPCTVIIENCHEGTLPDTQSFLSISAPNIQLSALKESEDKTGTVIRAWECDGKDTDVTFSGKVLPAELNTHFPPLLCQNLLI